MDIFKLVGRIVIKNEEANQTIDETTEKAKGLSETLQGTGGEADNASRKLGSSGKLGSASVWMGNMFTKLTEKGIAFGKFIGKTGFGFDAAMEAYENQFAALLDDPWAAKELVADLQKLAKISPLGMEGLANNAVSLLNSGTELADIIPTLEMLGNLSLGDTNKMNSVVRAYTQILSKGQLMAQEMYQLGDAGVPIRQIMTDYGGSRYADGSWYEAKMTDPTFKIPAEDMVVALRNATSESGMWYNYMFKMMDTWNGQVDRFGEEGKETLGAFMNPFFEMAKSNVLPRLSESLGLFGTWVSQNQGTLEKMADTTGKLVTGGFDMMIGAFTWMVDNGDATAAAIGVIATAMTVGAIAAHPYASAVLAVAAGLAMLKSAPDDPYVKQFDGFSSQDLQTMQDYVDAMNAVKKAEAAYLEDSSEANFNAYKAAEALEKMAKDKAMSVEGLISAYNTWHSGQANYMQDGMYLDVPLKVADGAEASLQGEVDGMNIESLVNMVADTSGLQAAVNATNLKAYVNLVPTGMPTAGATQVDGSHATGLWRVPRDGYIARLHQDEMVLNDSNADIVRSGSMGNTGRLETMLSQLISLTQQLVSSSGKQIVLDSGVLVGQLAPALDTQLGTISSRKGRRN